MDKDASQFRLPPRNSLPPDSLDQSLMHIESSGGGGQGGNSVLETLNESSVFQVHADTHNTIAEEDERIIEQIGYRSRSADHQHSTQKLSSIRNNSRFKVSKLPVIDNVTRSQIDSAQQSLDILMKKQIKLRHK